MNAQIDISSIILKTDRLLLRPWRETDLQDFYNYASVDGVGQMAGWTPHKDLAESRRILEHFIENKKTFALEYQGKVIGWTLWLPTIFGLRQTLRIIILKVRSCRRIGLRAVHSPRRLAKIIILSNHQLTMNDKNSCLTLFIYSSPYFLSVFKGMFKCLWE